MENVQIKEAIGGLVDFMIKSLRSPILHTPAEVGLAYEEVFFPSLDGTPLEGWFIPATTNKLVICNHFAPGNRSGWPGNLEPYKSFNPVEVNFIPEYKALHDAGYNVLVYDFRNHGRSAQGSGGLVTNGLFESRDVIGSVRFAKTWKKTKDMKRVLKSVCIGANSTMVAMSQHPEEFEDIKAMVAPQPISLSCFAEGGVKSLGLGIENGLALLDGDMFNKTGIHIDEMSPVAYAKDVKLPTLITQVKRDTIGKAENVQDIFDRLGSREKELFWIEDTDQRFEGYNYLGKHPKIMIDWFEKYINA